MASSPPSASSTSSSAAAAAAVQRLDPEEELAIRKCHNSIRDQVSLYGLGAAGLVFGLSRLLAGRNRGLRTAKIRSATVTLAAGMMGGSYGFLQSQEECFGHILEIRTLDSPTRVEWLQRYSERYPERAIEQDRDVKEKWAALNLKATYRHHMKNVGPSADEAVRRMSQEFNRPAEVREAEHDAKSKQDNTGEPRVI